MIDIKWYIPLIAFILDFTLGDPAILPHPVIYMGHAINFFESRFRKYIRSPFIAGFFFACFLILLTWMTAFIIIKLCLYIHPVLGNIIQTILLFFCFSSKSLERAALRVFHALKKKDIKKARKSLSMIVGRETQNLDETAVIRAGVETVAENFVDGFLSPLFFFMIGGIPWALTYKMINTLDSMVGYKNETYLFFGRSSARIDDVVNFIPARLSVFIIALSAGLLSLPKGILALKTGFSQGCFHKSPNAGYPEASIAGALQIKLGGPNKYHGVWVEKPYIGAAFKDPDKEKIKQACDLMMLGSFLAVLISCFILFIF